MWTVWLVSRFPWECRARLGLYHPATYYYRKAALLVVGRPSANTGTCDRVISRIVTTTSYRVACRLVIPSLQKITIIVVIIVINIFFYKGQLLQFLACSYQGNLAYGKIVRLVNNVTCNLFIYGIRNLNQMLYLTICGLSHSAIKTYVQRDVSFPYFHSIKKILIGELFPSCYPTVCFPISLIPNEF